MAKAARAKADLIDDLQENEMDGKASETTEQPGYYEEWRCEVKFSKDAQGNTVRSVEKIKRLRPKVKISEEYADVLNQGALHSPRADYVIAYFLPGSDQL